MFKISSGFRTVFSGIKTVKKPDVESSVLIKKHSEKALSFHPIDPKVVFKNQMRETRKQYLTEHKENIARLKLAQAKKLKIEKQAQRELEEDIERYKLESKSRTGLLMDDEKLQFNTTDYKTPYTKVELEKKKAEYNHFKKVKLEMSQKRVQNHLKKEERLSTIRKEQLLSLYYSSKDFITYRNLDQKLQDAFKSDGFISSAFEGGRRFGALSEAKKIEEDSIQRAQILQEALDGTPSDTKPPLYLVEEAIKKFEVENK